MQTRTYGDLFKLIQSLAGVTAFANNEQDDIANLINRRYQTAFNTSQIWPRYLVPSEERSLTAFSVSNFAEIYDGPYLNYGDDANGNPVYIKNQKNAVVASSRSSAAFVFDNINKVWQFLGGSFSKNIETGVVTYSSDALILNQRDTSIEYDNPWEVVWEISGSTNMPQFTRVQVVEYVELVPAFSSSDPVVEKETIGEFIRIHRKDSFLNNSAVEYDFYVNEEGANILNISNASDTSVFVTYKKKFTPFTTSSDYTTSTEEVPGEFFQYIAYGTYADFLRMDGQHDKAQLESENAELSLAQQLERVDAIMNNNTINKKFSTYVNRQSR